MAVVLAAVRCRNGLYLRGFVDAPAQGARVGARRGHGPGPLPVGRVTARITEYPSALRASPAACVGALVRKLMKCVIVDGRVPPSVTLLSRIGMRPFRYGSLAGAQRFSSRSISNFSFR